MTIEELQKEIETHRRALAQLEAELRRARDAERDRVWYPRGFYTAYHVLSGMVLGMVASWVVLLLHMLGAWLVGAPPLKLLRVYSTILGGERTAESSESVILIFALGIHTLTGVVCGAPLHTIYSRFFPGRLLTQRLISGIWLGLIMWVINFYGILSWLQPLLLGEETSYIVEHMPVSIAALTHIAFTEVVLILQPLAVFNVRNYAPRGEATVAAASP